MGLSGKEAERLIQDLSAMSLIKALALFVMNLVLAMVNRILDLGEKNVVAKGGYSNYSLPGSSI